MPAENVKLFAVIAQSVCGWPLGFGDSIRRFEVDRDIDHIF